jgi:hypothetical protein
LDNDDQPPALETVNIQAEREEKVVRTDEEKQ